MPHTPTPSGSPRAHHSRFAGLSNLRINPNLLTRTGYDNEIYACTLPEILDFQRRAPLSFYRERLSPAQRAEFLTLTGPSTRPIPRLDADARETRWLVSACASLPEAVYRLEERADLEEAIELLIVARTAFNVLHDPTTREQCAEWDRRICAVLARPEFRLTADLIEQRLRNILGVQLIDPNARVSALPASSTPAI